MLSPSNTLIANPINRAKTRGLPPQTVPQYDLTFKDWPAMTPEVDELWLKQVKGAISERVAFLVKPQ